VKFARATFTFALAALLISGATSLYAAKHIPESKDDVAKTVVPDPLAAARVAAGGDALLDALLTELDRSRAQLKMDQVAAPYYIEYRLLDLDVREIVAEFGTLLTTTRGRNRFMNVEARVGTYKLEFNPVTYVTQTEQYLQTMDVVSGLIKAAVFGFVIALMGCYHGYHSRGGAEGVGQATTHAVVSASILILIFNYALTQAFFS